MSFTRPDPRSRALAGFAALGVQLLFGWLLVAGLTIGFAQPESSALKVFDIAPSPTPTPPPPVVLEPNPVPDTRPEGEASPPNLRGTATPLEVPEPIVPPPPPPIPITVTPRADIGTAATTGSADIAGPGTGSGGIGDGRGSGGRGDGDGAGGRETPPRLLRGRLRDSDFPRAAAEAGAGGAVEIRFVVGTDGRVSDCEIERTSGNRELDDTTCRLVTQRYRFAPSRDVRGRPVPAIIIENHEWVNELGPPEDAPPPRRRR